jgi:hypothetical protein
MNFALWTIAFSSKGIPVTRLEFNAISYKKNQKDFDDGA